VRKIPCVAGTILRRGRGKAVGFALEGEEPYEWMHGRHFRQARVFTKAVSLQTLPREQLNSGSSEICNWICTAGALELLDLRWVDYFPGYRTSVGTGTGLCFASWA